MCIDLSIEVFFKSSPDPDQILTCTACSKQINPNINGNMRRHPVLRVLICKVSLHIYNNSRPRVQFSSGTLDFWAPDLVSIMNTSTNFKVVITLQQTRGIRSELDWYNFYCPFQKCYQWYMSDEIDQDSNGIDEQCRWCGEGGNLLCCDFCHNAFCKKCIKRNLGRSQLQEIQEAGE